MNDIGLPFNGADVARSVITVSCQKETLNNGINEVLFNSASCASKRKNLPHGKPNATSELVSILKQIAKRADVKMKIKYLINRWQ